MNNNSQTLVLCDILSIPLAKEKIYDLCKLREEKIIVETQSVINVGDHRYTIVSPNIRSLRGLRHIDEIYIDRILLKRREFYTASDEFNAVIVSNKLTAENIHYY